MKFYLLFLILFNIFVAIRAYDIRDYENIREQAVRNILNLENILEHRQAAAAASHRSHHKISKSRRIGGNIVMG